MAKFFKDNSYKTLLKESREYSSEGVFRAFWVLGLSMLMVCLCCWGITIMLDHAKQATIRLKLLEQGREKNERELHNADDSQIQIDEPDDRDTFQSGSFRAGESYCFTSRETPCSRNGEPRRLRRI